MAFISLTFNIGGGVYSRAAFNQAMTFKKQHIIMLSIYIIL